MKNLTKLGSIILYGVCFLPLAVTGQTTVTKKQIQEVKNQTQKALDQSNHQQNQPLEVHFKNGKTDRLRPEQILRNDEILKLTLINLGDSIVDVKSSELKTLKDLLPNRFENSTFKTLPSLFINEITGSNSPALFNIIVVSYKPLIYDYTTKTFKGNIEFIVSEQTIREEHATATLKTPLEIQITSPDVATINPNVLKLDMLYTPVRVNFEALRILDVARYKISTYKNMMSINSELLVQPALEIVGKNNTLQGLGIQTVPITIRYIGSSSTQETKISLTSEGGEIFPNVVTVRYNEPAIAQLRSAGLGSFAVTARTPDNQEQSITFLFVFPWIFLGLSISGGGIGALAKAITKRGKIMQSILTGMLIGLIGAIAFYVLGIKLLNFQVDSTLNEFAVFGFSALCAFFGIRKPTAN